MFKDFEYTNESIVCYYFVRIIMYQPICLFIQLKNSPKIIYILIVEFRNQKHTIIRTISIDFFMIYQRYNTKKL